MVYHSIVINVTKNTNDCVLDILEKDKNSHQLLIKLVCGCDEYYNVSGYTPEITFYNDSTGQTVLTTAVDVVNPYRGQLSYILGTKITDNPGKYVATLKLIESGQTTAQISCNFILNIVKDPGSGNGCCCCNNQTEVTISKEFYDQLKSHLENKKIHVSESDRVILDFFSRDIDISTIVTTGSTNNFDQLAEQVINKILQDPNQESTKYLLDLTFSDPRFKEISQNVSNLNDITNNLTKNLTSLDNTVTNVTNTVTALTGITEGLDQRVTRLENNGGGSGGGSPAEIEEIKSQIDTINTQISDLETTTNETKNKVDSYEDRIVKLESDVGNLPEGSGSIADQIADLSNKVENVSDPSWNELI